MPLAIGKENMNDSNKFSTYNENIELKLNNEIINFTNFSKIISLGEYLSEITGFDPVLLKNVLYEIIEIEHNDKNNEYKKINEDATPGILNSFYLEDINRVLNAVDNNDIGNALERYLSKESIKKVNLEKVDNVKQILTSDDIPYARWPKNANHSLSLMQSVAVKKSLDLKEDVFSVNGPPGTGKTTLLKDIIANIIYKRAEILAEYDNPADIFTKIDSLKVDGYSFNIQKLDEKLSKYSIVIASSNNGAVENITKELPLMESIDEEFVDEDLYFSKTSDKIAKEKTWGLISAALGNYSNKQAFFKDLWFNGEDSGNLQEYLKCIGDITWKEAVDSFNNKKLAVENEILEIKAIEKLQEKQKSLSETEEKEAKKNRQLIERLETFNTKKLVLEEESLNLTNEIKMMRDRRNDLMTFRFLWIILIFNYTNYKRIQSIDKEIQEYHDRLESNRKEINDIDEKESKIYDKLNHSNKILDDLRKEMAYNKEKIKRMRQICGKNFVDDDYWKKPYEDLQKSSPWLYKRINKLRSELFLESLRLHKAMIVENRRIFRVDIMPSITKLLYNKMDFEDADTYGNIIWNNFFLLVPVISSTFASFENMGKYLKQESIGWLLIDEAGQAVPQAALGAIWRSRNVVAVGDPRQIEPVVSTPNFLFTRLKKEYNLNYRYLSKNNSVQSIIDSINKYGGEINKQWVGCPLTVHRRCIDPMFSISNRIAYDNKMVCATIPPKEEDIRLGSSFWINMEGFTTSKHYVKSQGKMIRKILRKKYKNCENPNVYIISPFKDVVNGLKNDLRSYEYSRKWINNSIGTIHTFQGKEEKAVIICLGLDKKSEGAANWASEKPNILNVAVSRAKYELVIIGDLNLWGNKEYFNYVKNKLDVFEESDVDIYFDSH